MQAALPICVAYSLEAMTDHLKPQVESLCTLHRVFLLLQDIKWNPGILDRLRVSQKVHMEKFVAAYGRDVVRPKFHLAVHIADQCQMWGKFLDCFSCERKHRAYRSYAHSNVCRRKDFTRTVLLKLNLREAQPHKKKGAWQGHSEKGSNNCAVLGWPPDLAWAVYRAKCAHCSRGFGVKGDRWRLQIGGARLDGLRGRLSDGRSDAVEFVKSA